MSLIKLLEYFSIIKTHLVASCSRDYCTNKTLRHFDLVVTIKYEQCFQSSAGEEEMLLFNDKRSF